MRLRRRTFLRLGLLGALGLAGARGLANTRAVELVRVEVGLPRLPPAWEGLKVAQLTDFHAGRLVSADLIRAGVDLAASARPDLVVLTGDFVTAATRLAWGRVGGFRPRDLEGCLAQLRRLSAPLGLFAVLGNHDFWAGPEVAAAVAEGLRRSGVRVLRNEAVRLERDGAGLDLLGVDDYWAGSYNLARAVREAPPGGCRLLLSHNPDVNEDIEAQGFRVDLVLSGHTHGGQVVLPLVGAPFLPSSFGQKYRAGLVRDGRRQTYVSRGLGVFFLPLRFNCPPEVTLLTLRRGACRRTSPFAQSLCRSSF